MPGKRFRTISYPTNTDTVIYEWTNSEMCITVISTLLRPTPTITTLIILAHHIPNSGKAKRARLSERQARQKAAPYR